MNLVSGSSEQTQSFSFEIRRVIRSLLHLTPGEFYIRKTKTRLDNGEQKSKGELSVSVDAKCSVT